MARTLISSMFRHEERNLTVAIRGDNLVEERESPHLDYDDKVLDSAVEIIRVGCIGATDRPTRMRAETKRDLVCRGVHSGV